MTGILARDPIQEEIMKRYQCTICGHIYNPADGNPTQKIAPGTSFDDIPGSWVCPICGAKKSLFREALE